MSDAQYSENRNFNLHTAGTDLVEGSALAVSSAAGAIVVDGVTISAVNHLATAVQGFTAADAAITSNPVTLGGRASTATPTAMSADGDVVNLWLTREGAAVIAGDRAHDAVDAGNPIKVGGVASTTAPTDVAIGDRVAGWFLRNGAQVVTLANSTGSVLQTVSPSDGVAGLTGLVVWGENAVMNSATTNWDRQVSVSNGTNSTGAGIAAAGLIAQVDDTSPTAITENQFGNVRMSSRRVLYGEGLDAHDAAVSANPFVVGGRASAAAPTDVSADGDAVRAWFLRSGAAATVITAAGALIGGDATNGLDVDVTRLPALPAGTNNIGDVDVLTVPAPLSTTGGGTEATALRVTVASDSTGVLSVDDNGASLTVDGTVTAVGGTAADAAIANNPVTIGGRASNATPSAMSADGDVVNAWYTLHGAANVRLVDGSGNAVSVGGGTQYAEDAALGAVGSGTGTLAIGRASAAAPTAVSADGDAVAAWYGRSGEQMAGTGPGFARVIAQQSASTTGALASFNTQGATSIAMDVRGTYTGLTFNVEYSWDGTNFTTLSASVRSGLFFGSSVPYNVFGSTIAVAAANVNLQTLTFGARLMRVNVTAISTGTATFDVTATRDAMPLPVIVEGIVAHDSVDPSGSGPLKMGGKATTSVPPTAVGNLDRVDAWYDQFGKQTVNIGVAYSPSDGVSNTAIFSAPYQPGSSTGASGFMTGNILYNGATWDRQRSVPGVTGATAVGGLTAVDAAIAAAPVTVGGRGSTAVPTAMSADGDVVNAWLTLEGAQVIAGDRAHDAVDAGFPQKIGGKYTASPSNVADGDRVNAQFDGAGKLGTFLGDRNNNNYAFVGAGPSDGDGTTVVALYTAARMSAFDGANWDNARSVEALTTAPNTDVGVLAFGTGPGYDRKRNPSNLGTAVNSAITVSVDGADVITFDIGTGTTGTVTFEYTTDDTNWATHTSVLRLGSLDLWWDGVAFAPVAQSRWMLRCTGLRQVRLRTVTTLGATVAVKWTASLGQALVKSHDNNAPPHAIGFALESATAQYSTTQTSTTLGPTVSSSQRMVVTSIQIATGGNTGGTLQVYFGTGAYSRGTSKAIFDGEFLPSTSSKPGYALSPSVPWMGAADEELKVTDTGPINPLTVTVWYYLVPA